MTVPDPENVIKIIGYSTLYPHTRGVIQIIVSIIINIVVSVIIIIVILIISVSVILLECTLERISLLFTY